MFRIIAATALAAFAAAQSELSANNGGINIETFGADRWDVLAASGAVRDVLLD